MSSSKSLKSQSGIATIIINSSQNTKKVQLKSDESGIVNLDKQGEAIVVIPPDGSWGWLIVAAAFIIHFLNDGLIYTFALFLNDIAASLHCSTTKVALTNSILTGTFYLSGPLVSALINTFGYRKVAVAGGVLTSLSLLLSSNCEELGQLFLWCGFCAGISLQMTCMSSLIVVSFYFEKWRALAQSIMSCGSSMGVTFFPIIFGLLLQNLSWRFKFKIMSCCGLVCSLCALLYRPLTPVRIVEEQKMLDTIEELPDEHDATQKPDISKSEWVNSTEDCESTSRIMLQLSEQSSTSFFIESVSPVTSASVFTIKSQTKSRTSNVSKIKGSVNRLITVLEESEEFASLHLRDRLCLSCTTCYSSTTPGQPLCRDDIFYPASLSTLPEYIKSGQVQVSKDTNSVNLGYHISVTRVSNQIRKENVHRCTWFLKSFTRMLNFSMLKSRPFILISMSGLFTVLGLYTPFMFIVERAVTNGMHRNLAYHLITAIGVANTLGRIAAGILSSFSRIDALFISYVCLSITGLVLFVSSAPFSSFWQFFCATMYGINIGLVIALRPVIMVEIVGLQNLTSCFGLNLVFQGVASLLGIPLSGYLKIVTKSYDPSFYFSGCVTILSALFLFPLKSVKNKEPQSVVNH